MAIGNSSILSSYSSNAGATPLEPSIRSIPLTISTTHLTNKEGLAIQFFDLTIESPDLTPQSFSASPQSLSSSPQSLSSSPQSFSSSRQPYDLAIEPLAPQSFDLLQSSDLPQPCERVTQPYDLPIPTPIESPSSQIKPPRSVSSSEKIHRVKQKVKLITQGAAEIRHKGLEPLIMIPNATIEKFTPEHYLSHNLLNARMAWKEAKYDQRPLEEWVAANPEMCPQESVRYLKPHERDQFHVTVQDGKLSRAGIPYSTENESTCFSGAGTAIFVQGPDQEFYMSSHVGGQFHHSSFFSGEAIISGGEIKTAPDGTIVKITSKSGHYRPSTVHNLATLKRLDSQNVDLSRVVFEELSGNNFTYVYNNAKLYLETNGQILPDNIFLPLNPKP